MAITEDIRETLDVLKGIFSDGSGVVTPDIAKTLNVASGLQMYNLEPAAKVLTPIFSPIRNKLPRVPGHGKAIEFKAITEVDTTGQSAVAIEGTLANAVTTGIADVTIAYRPFGLSSDPVTYEAEWAAEGFATKPRELAIANLLKATMRAEEKLILFGQGQPGQITTNGTDSWTFGGMVGNAPQPVVADTTGGTIASSSTVYVVETVLTGMGESLPSAVVTHALGASANAITVTPVYPTGIPALSFNIYVGTSASGPFYLAASTNGAAVTINAVPNSGQTPPTTDNSGNTNAFNGIFAYLFAQGSGAQITKLGGELTSLSPIDSLLESLFDNSAADPSDMYVNSYESKTITKLVLGQGSTPYFLTIDNQNAATANYRVARYVNPITGTEVKINVHKYMPQGNILVLSHNLPEWYVGSDIEAPFQMNLVQDYTEIDYPPTAASPRWISEIRCFGALQGYIPSVHGAIVGISK
ncbi:hypothetical protein Tsac_2859 [Thermoanaerobacterium phage THSA-485A]|uniref:hypothetical protein n=1 Tax=Thermoanaerobacterium phage THSA-485A TaxID=1126885 RepID=UPI000263F844|nr:hypothetical protein Tsac_2859 [Thermoanaerobacterium phage THSA-485A]AFK87712.1 hypothetical protein Tsac_2859 [Thermoanaerobacterium phage THSA-485A]